MIKQLQDIVGEKNLFCDYPLKDCCSFGIGGTALFYATPESIDGLFNLVEFATKHSLRYKIIGNGTNLLFSDNGFKGLIISTKKLIAVSVVEDNKMLASAGVCLSSLIHISQKNGLCGLEFAVGIPGTLGGAIVMNAGAEGSEISSVIESVTIIENGDIRVLTNSQLDFGYRSSYFLSNPTSIILFAELKLNPINSLEQIKDRMKKNLYRRNSTQPKQKSAGCVFKKCEDIPAGLLIDQAGLKGQMIGGAKVSEVHANFIVNENNATAKDVKSLIKLVQQKVYKQFKKTLQLEIEIIE